MMPAAANPLCPSHSQYFTTCRINPRKQNFWMNRKRNTTLSCTWVATVYQHTLHDKTNNTNNTNNNLPSRTYQTRLLWPCFTFTSHPWSTQLDFGHDDDVPGGWEVGHVDGSLFCCINDFLRESTWAAYCSRARTSKQLTSVEISIWY